MLEIESGTLYMESMCSTTELGHSDPPPSHLIGPPESHTERVF